MRIGRLTGLVAGLLAAAGKLSAGFFAKEKPEETARNGNPGGFFRAHVCYDGVTLKRIKQGNVSTFFHSRCRSKYIPHVEDAKHRAATV